MFRFNLNSLLLSVGLLAILIFIAAFVHDQFIRPFGGDVLVVVWLYFFMKSFLNMSPLKLSIGVLFFAYGVEIAQYFNLVTILGLEEHKLARIIIGSTFDFMDLFAYTIGWVLIIAHEWFWTGGKSPNTHV